MHYRVLGPLSPGSASAQQRLLLCCLLARANRFVAAGRLVEELWGEALPADPGAALRTQVSRLRRRLPADALITEPGGYRLVVAPGDLDSAVFEELLGEGQVGPALALWRGAAFEEFADRALVQAEATRLEKLRLDAEERRARMLLMSGDAGAAATAAGELLAEEPERESVRAVLMEALYRGGRQGAALDVYQSWRQELSDQLGLDPTPELARLHQHILEQRMPLVTVPKPVDSFLGRDPELAEVRQRLRFARLVTLTGPGGVGKTRLAVETAHTVAADYPDGVTICELTAVGRSDAVARAIGWTVGLTETGAGRLEDQLVGYLRSRRLLIVLDGCEHVLDAAADIAGEILRRTTGIAILATSRERLAAPAEHVFPVPPLSAAASTRLFRDRAHSVSAGLAVTDELVAEVCARLDGLPLALELAAARVGSLRVEDMVSALDDRFAVLADRRRSLAATLQWSYDLLGDAEREGLCRLALFHGAFDRAAANEFGVDTGVLLRLAERSLVDGANPYRMLDSVRDYARARLHERRALDASRPPLPKACRPPTSCVGRNDSTSTSLTCAPHMLGFVSTNQPVASPIRSSAASSRVDRVVNDLRLARPRGVGQPRDTLLSEPLPPLVDRRAGHPQPAGDRRRALPVGGREHDFSPQHQTGRHRRRPPPRLQRRPVLSRQIPRQQ